MKTLDDMLSWMSFVLLGVVTWIGPWLFGAWEMWWFWGFTGCLFAATALFGVRLMLAHRLEPEGVVFSRPVLLALAAVAPFLLYAFLRFLMAEVYMDAEHGFLLFLTPILVAVLVAAGFSRRQLRIWVAVLLADFFLLGGYGVVNHLWFGSRQVLWMPGYPQYVVEWRATGSYYCPDHFAGLMELALCVGLALVLTRGTHRGWRWAGASLSLLALPAIGLSQSRGGSLTVAAVLLAVVAIGLASYPVRIRWALRFAVAAVLAVGAAYLAFYPGGYAARFRNYSWQDLRKGDRGIMIGGALRAWRTAPVWGIGPNMHRNLWPRFAASGDGDRVAGRLPTDLNNSFHSFEVHSDWVQLLEEHGLVGFAFFGVGLAALLRLLLQQWRRTGPSPGPPADESGPLRPAWPALAALLALVAMGFHSLGDFNLQMPATTWLLAALVALPLGFLAREEN